MPDLWLDVTTSYRWRRAPVGIVRVEIELVKNARRFEFGTIRYCRFDRDRNSFMELSKNDVFQNLDMLENVLGKEECGDLEKNSRVKLPKLWGKSYELIETIFKKLPNRSKVLNKIIKRRAKLKRSLLKRVPIKLREAYEAWTASSESALPSLINRRASGSLEAGAIFSKGDFYLSCGLDWDDKDTDLLFYIKKQYGLKVILFCYDLIPVKFPHLCVGDTRDKFLEYFASVAWVSDLVVCISKCTKNDLVSVFSDIGTPIPKMIINKLGCDLKRLPTSENGGLRLKLERQEYILFVSTIERRKNHEVLYRAYSRLILAGHTKLPTLVFVGMKGWGVSDFLDDIKYDPRIKNYVKVFNNVHDQDLGWLYENCLFTVYPSLYEGWGLPVVESLAHGKFCIASREASIPEAGGEFCDYLDPWNVSEWQDAIIKYSCDSQELLKREAHIRDDFRPTTWIDSVESLIEKVSFQIKD